jgi:hypothetical protein
VAHQQLHVAGNQPWHLDASQTAMAFAAWLGYASVNTVIATTTNATGAHVTIGSQLNRVGTPVVCAVVHLVRWGTGADSSWEVIGTENSTVISLTSPAYGATVTSPVRVTGFIAPPEQTILVKVQSAPSQMPTGGYCCVSTRLPNTRWSATTVITASPGSILTIAASATGGHTPAERFTVTGVRSGP